MSTAIANTHAWRLTHRAIDPGRNDLLVCEVCGKLIGRVVRNQVQVTCEDTLRREPGLLAHRQALIDAGVRVDA